MNTFVEAVKNRLRAVTVVEWLVTVAILATLLAILLPEAQWASDGDIVVPVRVLVFDVKERTPLAKARVMLVMSPSAAWPEFMQDLQEMLPGRPSTLTDTKGTAIIKQQFYTGASNKNPIPRAHLENVWVVVEAEGYGGVAVPVRHESLPSAEVKKRGELLVPVGLIAVK